MHNYFMRLVVDRRIVLSLLIVSLLVAYPVYAVSFVWDKNLQNTNDQGNIHSLIFLINNTPYPSTCSGSSRVSAILADGSVICSATGGASASVDYSNIAYVNQSNGFTANNTFIGISDTGWLNVSNSTQLGNLTIQSANISVINGNISILGGRNTLQLSNISITAGEGDPNLEGALTRLYIQNQQPAGVSTGTTIINVFPHGYVTYGATLDSGTGRANAANLRFWRTDFLQNSTNFNALEWRGRQDTNKFELYQIQGGSCPGPTISDPSCYGTMSFGITNNDPTFDILNNPQGNLIIYKPVEFQGIITPDAGATISGSLVPTAGSTYNLGSPGSTWLTTRTDNLITTTIYGAGTAFELQNLYTQADQDILPLSNNGQNLGGFDAFGNVKNWKWVNTTFVNASDTINTSKLFVGNNRSIFPLSCSGTNKVSSIDANGFITCSADQSGSSDYSKLVYVNQSNQFAANNTFRDVQFFGFLNNSNSTTLGNTSIEKLWSNLVPFTDLAWNLGASALRWSDTYSSNFWGRSFNGTYLNGTFLNATQDVNTSRLFVGNNRSSFPLSCPTGQRFSGLDGNGFYACSADETSFTNVCFLNNTQTFTGGNTVNNFWNINGWLNVSNSTTLGNTTIKGDLNVSNLTVLGTTFINNYPAMSMVFGNETEDTLTDNVSFKSFTLPANNFSRIIMEADYEIDGATGSAYNWILEFRNSTAIWKDINVSNGAVTAQLNRFGAMYSASNVQTLSSKLNVTFFPITKGSAIVAIQSLRIYGAS